MSRKFLLLLLILPLLFACQVSSPPPPTQTPAPSPTPFPSPTPPPAPSPTATLPSEQGTNGYTLVYIHRRDGALNDLLAEHARLAVAQGQEPVAYFTASWCSACAAISNGLSEQDPDLLEAFAGIYLIAINVDEWGWYHQGFPALNEGIPLFYRLDETGQPTGDWINGNAWGENTPENIAAAMRPWLQR